MGLLDGFEKLINEHGSETILKERIALANDKYSALEKKFTDLEHKCFESELRISNLDAENQALRLDNSKHREQIRNLEKQLIELIHNPILLFDEKSGTWLEEGKTIHYCPKCKASSTLSPMSCPCPTNNAGHREIFYVYTVV